MSDSLVVVIQQRGWVKIGYISRDGDMYRLRDSRTLIVWGTDGGLGIEHLAQVGPTSRTKYSENKANGRFHILSTIDILECTPEAVMSWEKAWKKK